MAPSPVASPTETTPICEGVDDGGYQCELRAGHAGEHRAVIDCYDEQGLIPERRWPSAAAPRERATADHELLDTLVGEALDGGRMAPVHLSKGAALAIDELQAQVRRLEAERDALRGALTEIAKGEGRYSRDPLKHAENTINSMMEIAQRALAAARVSPLEGNRG